MKWGFGQPFPTFTNRGVAQTPSMRRSNQDTEVPLKDGKNLHFTREHPVQTRKG
jgi:hypothetical protein